MNEIGVGLIGTGYMGKCHALAWRSVKALFGDVPEPRLEVLCDVPAAQAETYREQFGFARSTDDWRALVNDPRVDVVSITTPNGLHRDMAIAALEAGKHVWCEKPMALTLADAEHMNEAAVRAGVKTIVGYNYIGNPAFRNAQRLVREGAIGRPFHFRGVFDEDYQADPDSPWSWRCLTEEAGLGALGDMGCHVLSCAVGLMGPVESLIADMQIVHETRPRPDGGSGPVENEDVASALMRFESGAQGIISTSRVAWGCKNRLAWEVHGDKGAIRFDQERLNELELFTTDGPEHARGFRRILSGPAHPPFGDFCPTAGHGLGFNDLKPIELRGLLRAIVSDEPVYPAFSDALLIERTFHGIAQSAGEGRRIGLIGERTERD